MTPLKSSRAGGRTWTIVLVAVLAPVLGTAAVAAPPSSAAELPQAPTDARTLLQAMARVQGLEARFSEQKHLALLRKPLSSEGRIYYTRPGHLARITETPTPSTVRIGPTAIEVADATGKQQFDLRSRPDIKMFVESFVHVVAGNYDGLAATYTLGFEAPAAADDPWLLTLTPARKPLSELVERLEIRGRGYEVTTIRILEKRGDFTEITMSAVDPHRTFTDDERRALFGLTDE